MNWEIKSFQELSISELYKILQLRAEVFVVEQNCVYQDLDDKDLVSMHLMAWEGEQLIAYLRILPKGISFPETAMGRVLVRMSHRRAGIARQLMERGISYIKETQKETEIRISAQAYLIPFYESLNFHVESEIYLEDGIPHAEMLMDMQ